MADTNSSEFLTKEIANLEKQKQDVIRSAQTSVDQINGAIIHANLMLKRLEEASKPAPTSKPASKKGKKSDKD